MRNFFVLFFFLNLFLIYSCKSKDKNTNDGVVAAYTNGPVLESVKKMFPSAQNLSVDTLNNHIIVDFDNGKNECQSQFDANGKYILTYIYYSFPELPQNITDFISTTYANAIPSMSYLIDSLGTKEYRVEFSTSKDFISLNFDEKGNISSKKVEKLTPEEMRLNEEEGVNQDHE
jgi:hypothetical protein